MKKTIAPEQLFAQIDAVWRDACGTKAIPARADISPTKLAGALRYVALIDVVPGDPLDFRYRLVGEYLTTAFGHNVTGALHTAHFEYAPVRPFFDAYARCVTTKTQQDMIADFRNHNKTPCRARGHVWPLSEDGVSVTGLLGGCVYLEASTVG